ncbi:DHHC-type zinc finger protein [Plasmodium vivax North Korean]|uniref:Palmitoyltransferase n=1 Tax=Plasmodium vivax North Korean TaxID=1035514 RepID=A0A0J9WE93_PLAVI|nr:DHHC-type zinc finger protein [Plasmodium vivax North Korean]
MKNPLPCVVICIKLAVLATLTHLVHTGKLPIDGRSSFFFLYAASFLLYAISSLRDPGYLKSCPLAYLPKNERAAFQASLSDRTGGHTKRRDIPTACSITQDEIPSSDSFSSETVSTNAVPTLAVETLAVETLAVESFAVETLAVETLAVESFAVESFAVESFAVESFAVESRMVASLAVAALEAAPRSAPAEGTLLLFSTALHPLCPSLEPNEGKLLHHDSLSPPRQILRSRHCNACHRCVRTFDHHCPWINNCVAENNRGSYLMYLLFEGMAVFHTLRLLSRVLWGMLFGENGFV